MFLIVEVFQSSKFDKTSRISFYYFNSSVIYTCTDLSVLFPEFWQRYPFISNLFIYFLVWRNFRHRNVERGQRIPGSPLHRFPNVNILLHLFSSPFFHLLLSLPQPFVHPEPPTLLAHSLVLLNISVHITWKQGILLHNDRTMMKTRNLTLKKCCYMIYRS